MAITGGRSRRRDALRAIASEIVDRQKTFVLVDDDLAALLFDAQFWLLTEQRAVATRADYLAAYPEILQRGDGFATDTYDAALVAKWMDERLGSADDHAARGTTPPRRDCLFGTARHPRHVRSTTRAVTPSVAITSTRTRRALRCQRAAPP